MGKTKAMKIYSSVIYMYVLYYIIIIHNFYWLLILIYHFLLVSFRDLTKNLISTINSPLKSLKSIVIL